jgi:O-antigen/teichoic acid export membrane protein
LVPIPAFVAYILPSSVYGFILGEEFAESKVYAIIFLLGIAMTAPYFILGNYLFYHGKTGAVSLSTGLSSALHVGLIASLGATNLNFMACSLFITNTFTVCLVYYFCKRFYREQQYIMKVGN